MKSAKVLALFSILLTSLFAVTQVHAYSISVTGNGSDSTNQVTNNNNNSTLLNQDNSADITNNVSTNSQTGGNSTSANTGTGSSDTSISTGDVNSNTSISNSGINSSVVNSGCCASTTPSTITVSGNGSDSENIVQSVSSNTNQIDVNQKAEITNSIYGETITGKNTASDNTNGNISISTGSVSAINNVTNKNINQSVVSVGDPQLNSTIKIWGNGAQSQNYIYTNTNNSNVVYINNEAYIQNPLFWNAVTGKNNASENMGNVLIATGAIRFIAALENGPINNSVVNISCCQQKPQSSPIPTPPNGEKQPEKNQQGPTIPPTAPVPQSPITSVISPSTPTGILAAAITPTMMMPATGSSWITILTIIAGLLFILGLILRLHPGQDPGKI